MPRTTPWLRARHTGLAAESDEDWYPRWSASLGELSRLLRSAFRRGGILAFGPCLAQGRVNRKIVTRNSTHNPLTKFEKCRIVQAGVVEERGIWAVFRFQLSKTVKSRPHGLLAGQVTPLDDV
jgi:hypothetical protein